MVVKATKIRTKHFLIITEQYQFNDTPGCSKQTCDLKTDLKYTMLLNRYERLLKIPKAHYYKKLGPSEWKLAQLPFNSTLSAVKYL